MPGLKREAACGLALARHPLQGNIAALMVQHERKTGALVWVGLGLTCAILLTAFILATYRLYRNAGPPVPVYGQVEPFTLTNQLGAPVTLEDLRGHVWVADIIFTRCAGPCLRMTKRMHELQQALPLSSQTKLVSLTTDPDFDTPEVLRQYARRFDADTNRWTFLTGTKGQIASLAIGSLKLTIVEKSPEERTSPEDLFIHSTIFVIVDRQGRLRGIFETEADGDEQADFLSRVLPVIRQLERET
ncbi:MAG TPA: SCO family protein [Clostridia bacterium]|nr:SCO family protein [Clostridia bacterium]